MLQKMFTYYSEHKGPKGNPMRFVKCPEPIAFSSSSILGSVAFFMIGLGNGPLFPNFYYLTPESFGQDVSESVISLQMASAYVEILFGPLLCGQLGQNLGMFIFPFYVIIAFATMAFIPFSAQRLLKRKNKQ